MNIRKHAWINHLNNAKTKLQELEDLVIKEKENCNVKEFSKIVMQFITDKAKN